VPCLTLLFFGTGPRFPEAAETVNLRNSPATIVPHLACHLNGPISPIENVADRRCAGRHFLPRTETPKGSRNRLPSLLPRAGSVPLFVLRERVAPGLAPCGDTRNLTGGARATQNPVCPCTSLSTSARAATIGDNHCSDRRVLDFELPCGRSRQGRTVTRAARSCA
jgi:hypothetical protein